MSSDHNGQERRKDNQAHSELLIRIDENVMSIKDWSKAHDIKDDKRFDDINKKLLYGAISIILVASATGIVPQVLAYFK